MNGNMECGICRSKSFTCACTCYGDITPLCNNCINQHKSDHSIIHDLISREMAIRFELDPALSQEYFTNLIYAREFMTNLNLNARKLRQAKQNLESKFENIHKQVNDMLSENLYKLSRPESEIKTHLDIVSSYINNLSREGQELVSNYIANGKMLLPGIPDIELDTEEIAEIIRDKIQVKYRDSEPTEKRIKIECISEMASPLSQLEFHSRPIRQHLENFTHYQSEIYRLKNNLAISERANQDLINEIKALKDTIKSTPISHSISTQTHPVLPISSQTQPSSHNDIVLERLTQLESKVSNISSVNAGSVSDINALRSYKTIHDSLNLRPNNQKETFKSGSIEQRTSHFREFAGKRYIYTARNGSKELTRHDTLAQTSEVLTIPELTVHFLDTSTCELPNGNVFITGFNEAAAPRAYIYSVSKQELTRLGDLSHLRFEISLFCYKDYVYAFGGNMGNKPVSHAERYSLRNNRWEPLSDMRFKRTSISCVGLNDKIYLFTGKISNIEVLNISNCTFDTLKFKSVKFPPCQFGIAHALDNQIYLISDTHIQVYDTSFKRILKKPMPLKHTHYTINNIVSHNNHIFYYNFHQNTLEKVNISSLSNNPAVPIPKDQLKARYLYSTISNTPDIQQFDVKHKSIKTICIRPDSDFKFHETELCNLPEGRVFITDYHEGVSRCFIYDTISTAFTDLTRLDRPRQAMGIVYHDRIVYLFGGRVKASRLKYAERIDTERRARNTLNNLGHSREYPNCLAINNSIYIIGGGDTTIEIYNISTNSYTSIHNFINIDNVVSFCVGSLIYIVGDNYHKIMNNQHEVLQQNENSWEGSYPIQRAGSIVIYKDSAYYFNSQLKVFESCDLRRIRRRVEFINGF
jgi:hypothetical protein